MPSSDRGSIFLASIRFKITNQCSGWWLLHFRYNIDSIYNWGLKLITNRKRNEMIIMAIKHGIWRVTDDEVREVKNVTLDLEIELEKIIQSNLAILDDNWMIIGRQVMTEFNTYIDLLAIDNSGSIIIIELKKHKTSREVVAQGLDYASWVKSLSASQIIAIYEAYIVRYSQKQNSLEDAYYEKFKIKHITRSLRLNSKKKVLITLIRLLL
jgi:RecB family endonuclease NucS